MNICVAPRGVPSATSVYPDLRGVLRPPVPGACPDPVGALRFSIQVFHCQAIADSLFLLPLFLPARPFVFNRLRTLLPKTGGRGCLRTAPHYSLSTARYRFFGLSNGLHGGDKFGNIDADHRALPGVA